MSKVCFFCELILSLKVETVSHSTVISLPPLKRRGEHARRAAVPSDIETPYDVLSCTITHTIIHYNIHNMYMYIYIYIHVYIYIYIYIYVCIYIYIYTHILRIYKCVCTCILSLSLYTYIYMYVYIYIYIERERERDISGRSA